MNENFSIPSGWTRVKLGDIFSFKGGGTPSKSEPSYWGGNNCWASVKDIKGNYLYDTFDKITKPALKNSNTNVAVPGDVILVTRINPGKAIIAKVETAINQDLKIVVPKIKTSSDFIKYLFNSLEKKCVELSSGTTVLGISINNLSEIQILLPPFVEQQRIVAKIEELFSSLDKGIESLKAAQQQLKIYRQSVLKWAFEGTLASRNSKENELPDGWNMCTLEKITSILGDGLHGTPEYDDTGECFFINGNNLDDGKISIKQNTKRVSQKEYETYKKPLNELTILVSINGTLGNTAFYRQEKVILGKSACYFNLLKNVNKKYIRYYLSSPAFLNYANQHATGSTIKNVSLKAMREFRVPLPTSIEIQEKIVDEIERRLSVCDKLEENIHNGLEYAEILRQSVLKKAFEGKLVPQDLLASQTTLT